MKKIKLFLSSVVILAVFGCQKEPSTKTTISEFDGKALVWGSASTADVDGYVILEFSEYFDDKVGGVAAIFAAGFENNDVLIDAGTVTIGAFELEKGADNRHLLYPSTFNKADYLGQSVSTRFDSKNVGGFSDFTQSVYVPSQMNVKSNIGGGEYFIKSQDLVLSWTPDATADKVYIGICTPGLPCIFKEVDDTGSLTIPSSEFANFPVGNDISIHMGRGTQTCVVIGQKEVCITAYNNSRIPWLTIQ